MVKHKIMNRNSQDEVLKGFRSHHSDEMWKIPSKNLFGEAKKMGERMTGEDRQHNSEELHKESAKDEGVELKNSKALQELNREAKESESMLRW